MFHVRVRHVACLLVASVGWAVVGCKPAASVTTPEPTPVASVSVTAPSTSLVAGATVQLTVVTLDADGKTLTGRTITWSSASPAIASVSATGLVTAVSVGGPVTITAMSEGHAGTTAITVIPVPVATVTVTPPSISLVAGSATPLTVVVKDASGNVLTDRPVTWTSSNPSVASVSAAGVVTALAVGGPVTITATSDGQSGAAAVTITPIPVASVSVTPGTGSVVVGATAPLTATVKDASGNVLTDRTVVWMSSNVAVATVAANGVVTGVTSGGPVTITATSEGQNGSASITVTPVPVATITVAGAASLGVGLTAPFTATLKDAGGNTLSGRTVAWSSSNAAVASVNPATGVVTGVAIGGPVTITAASGGQTGTASTTIVLAVSAVVTANSTSCALLTDGTAYCWGQNGSGQVGDGTTSTRTVPTLVAGGLHYSSLTVGPSETCGLVVGSGAAYCWGTNQWGEAGDGTNAPHFTPTPAAGGLIFSQLVQFNEIACGGLATGAIYCWGNGSSVVQSSANLSPKSPVAVNNVVSLVFQQTQASASDLCGLAAGGVAYCWGANQGQALGDGSNVYFRQMPTAVATTLTFVAISGSSFNTCGIATGGAAWCWGRNSGGAFGDGTVAAHPTPSPVSGGMTFTTITTNDSFSCALTADGTAYCWGQNTSGALGDGTIVAHLLAAPVSGGLKFRTISAGTTHVCGVTTTGALYCWGDNTSGALGIGSAVANVSVPTAVMFH